VLRRPAHFSKEPMRVSIRLKLIVAILVPLLVIYLGVLAVNYGSGKRQVIEQARKHMRQLASNHAARLDAHFAMAELAAGAVAHLVAEQSTSLQAGTAQQARRIDTVLGRTVLRHPAIHGACLALEPDANAPEGDVARYVRRPDPRREPGRPGRPGGPETRPGQGKPLPGGHPRNGRRGPASRPVGPRVGRRGAGGRGGSRRPLGPRAGPALLRGDLATMSPDCRREEWYLAAKARNKPLWLAPSRVRTDDGVPVTRCAVPILRDETFLGAVAFDLAVELLQRYVAETKVEGGYCMLVDGTGLLIAHPQEGFAMHESLEGLAARHGVAQLEAMGEKVAAGQAGIIEMEDFHTMLPSFVTFAPLSSAGWSFAAVVPQQQIIAPVREWFRRDMAVMLGGLGVIILCMLLVSFRITRPIGALARAARELARGNLQARVHGVRSRDELGEFARAFNGMVRALREHVAALTRETAARRAVESEMQIAREIQASLLPRVFPRRREFDLHAMNVPAREVAGDFFDFFLLSEEVLAFLIADVSGKGVPAALYMAVTRTVIRDQAMGGATPADVLTRANRLLAQDNERTMFVTLFFGHYHLRTGRLVYANAGHNPPCVGSADGRVRRLDGSTGPILGVFGDKTYEQREARLGPRDSIVLYTDGVTEAMDAADRQFSMEHLERIIAGNPAASPEEVCGLVVQSVENYRAHPQQDDVTVLVLRRKL